MRSPLVLDPAPFVTRWRSRTVANGDSITLPEDLLRLPDSAQSEALQTAAPLRHLSSLVTAATRRRRLW